MLNVAGVTAGERVLVTGASGGVGTALIQLCRILGAVPLSRLREAEQYFVNRGNDYLGKIVIVPDSQWDQQGAPFAIEVAP
ncbi:hypothetical protein ACMDCT_15530 [Halomonadaceae bacterium KBTZ08]